MAKESKTKASLDTEATQAENKSAQVTIDAPADTGINESAESGKGMSYDVKFSSFANEGSIKGYCTVTLGGEFAIKGVKVIEGSKGLFVAMPSYKSGDEYKDICNPVTREARENLNNAVLKAYEQQNQTHVANMEASGIPENFHRRIRRNHQFHKDRCLPNTENRRISAAGLLR